MNINFTLVAQAATFAIFIWFTVRFVWPPLMRVVEERQQRIADGLAAGERGRQELEVAQKKALDEVRHARESNAEMRTAAEKQAAQLVDDARQESGRIITQARLAAEAEAGPSFRLGSGSSSGGWTGRTPCGGEAELPSSAASKSRPGRC